MRVPPAAHRGGPVAARGESMPRNRPGGIGFRACGGLSFSNGMTPRSLDQALVASLSVAASAGGRSPLIHACHTGASRAATARACAP